MSINLSSNGRAALASVANESAAEKLLRCKKIIIPLEQNPPNETSARILKDLRFTLRTVLKSKEATPEEVDQAGALLLRVRALGIRREEFRAKNRNEAEVDLPLEDHPIVAGKSASQVPRPVTLTWHGLIAILQEQLGDSRRFPDRDFGTETQLCFLEAVLGSKVTTGGIQSLLDELYKKDSNGWTLAISFPLVVRFVKEVLKQNGVTPNPEHNSESALKFLADIDAELTK